MVCNCFILSKQNVNIFDTLIPGEKGTMVDKGSKHGIKDLLIQADSTGSKRQAATLYLLFDAYFIHDLYDMAVHEVIL